MNEFMQLAILEAAKSGTDVPVGAIITKNGEILAKCHNEREKNSDISAHAEILAIREAEKKLGNWRLDECEIYVTLEPCPMCGWAILQSRIKSVYFGSYDKTYGAFGSALDLRNYAQSNLKIYSGIMEETCDNIINSFWKRKRKNS